MFSKLGFVFLALRVAAQEAVGEQAPTPVPALLTATHPTWVTAATTGLPFFADGQCNTIVNCGSLGGEVVVTTVTKEVPGVRPVGTDLTITPTSIRESSKHTVTVVPRATDTGVETVTIHVTPGATLTDTVLATPEPNAPATVWIFPGGPAPTSTVYVTSTLEHGHAGTETITIPGPPPLQGMPTTVTVIPPVTSDLTVDVCPPQQTVTIVEQPKPAATRNITQSDGSVKPAALSKFPCSDSDDKPCRGTQVEGWTVFKCLFGGSRVMDGNTYPNPWDRKITFDYDTILTVSDSWYQAEHWTVSLDGKEIGQTHENGFKNNMLSCTWDGDSCIAKGFSHGSFLIPKGSHDLSIAWTDGPLTYSGGWKWTHGYGVYRFDRLCSCGSGHNEL